MVRSTSRPDGSGGALQLELLAARHGDSVLLEYGPPDGRRRVLVDGGPHTAYPAVAARLRALPPGDRRLELLVVTHVDADHIEGVIRLLSDAELAVEVGEVWFNGYRHLPADELGAPQGEMLSALIEHRHIPWNARFGGGAVKRATGRPLPCRELPGGLALTVLAPTDRELRILRRDWLVECRRAGIAPGSRRDGAAALAEAKRLGVMDSYLGGTPDVAALASTPQTERDTSAANGSSIVLLAEYGGQSVLLTGDATPSALAAGLKRLAAERGRPVVRVDALKLPHHGSRYNVVRDVLDLVRTDLYLVSTDGSYFQHPDDAALARLLVDRSAGTRILFNYRTPKVLAWADPRLVDAYGHRPQYPVDGTAGIGVTL
jgi:beta-lactamase superfamily II metal-dependent hydrolase